MNFIEDFKNNLFKINEGNFEIHALALYEFQYHHNAIYRQYCDSLHKSPSRVKLFQDIPFLPIEFFKKHRIVASNNPTEKIFKSSGTTQSARSEHLVKDLSFYHRLSKRAFQDVFGSLDELQIIALLPSYLEQGDSSLVSMVDGFIQDARPGSGYFLGQKITELLHSAENKILIGVTYALLDLQFVSSKSLTVIETGGMKGRKKEITRDDLHMQLKSKLGTEEIWSEYGMTELLSQAYGLNGKFKFPDWATVRIREINDPFAYPSPGKTGGINIVDLANVESCAFIETKDLGIMQKNGQFEVLGRFDNSDVRGCSLLI